MLKKRGLAISAFLLATIGSAFPQKAGGPSIGVMPTCNIPLGSSTGTYTTGVGAELQARYVFPSLHALVGFSYNKIPISGLSTSLSTLGVGIGGGMNHTFFGKLQVETSAEGGVLMALFDSNYAIGAFIQAGAGVAYVFSPSFSLGADIEIKNYFGPSDTLFAGLGVSLKAVILFPPRTAPRPAPHPGLLLRQSSYGR